MTLRIGRQGMFELVASVIGRIHSLFGVHYSLSRLHCVVMIVIRVRSQARNNDKLVVLLQSEPNNPAVVAQDMTCALSQSPSQININ